MGSPLKKLAGAVTKPWKKPVKGVVRGVKKTVKAVRKFERKTNPIRGIVTVGKTINKRPRGR